jgi:hypothetical protein
MFEVFGPLTKATPSVVPLLLALWPLAGALACFGDPRRARMRAVAVSALGAVAAAFVLVVMTRWPSEERVLLRHLGVAARVGQLDLVLALALDPLAAFASAAAFVVTALLVARQRRAALGARRRIALLCAMGCAVQLAVMADGLTTLVLAAALSSLAGAALGFVRVSCFVADRIAEVALVSAAAIAFWTLGGSWIDDQYVPELDARLVVSTSDAARSHDGRGDRASTEVDDDDDERPARTATRPARPGAVHPAHATLSLTSLPGAAVLVDGAWLRVRSAVRAPFADVPIAAGPHTIRVHVGAGADDYYIPRVTSADGEHVWLAVRGATTTFREMTDDLLSSDGSERGARAAVARRSFFGASAAGLVLVLVFVAFVARARLFPFGAAPSPGNSESARSLAAIVTLVMVARYPFEELSPRTAAAIACVLGVGSVMAFAGALRGHGAHAMLAGELGLAGAGFAAGAPAIAVLHGALAALVLTRPRKEWPRVATVLFFPTRVAIIGALGGLAFGAFPTALGLGAAWMGALATSQRGERPRAPISITLFVASGVAFVFAIDPRAFGFAREPVVASLLEPSFRAFGSFPRCSLPVFFLVAALHAFAWAFSRSRACGALASSAALRLLDGIAPAVSRGVSAIVSAVAAALSEVEARSSTVLDAVDRLVLAACTLLAFVDETVTSLAPHRIPLPSERVARLVLAPIALATVALFALPWLG